MLSSVSKLADKNFILGFFLPALLAVIAAANIFPAAWWSTNLLSAIRSKDSIPELTYFVLSVWVLGVLLLAVNYELYRLLEGYSPPVSWLASLRKWHARNFRKLKRKCDAMSDAYARAGDAYPVTRQHEWMNLKLRLGSEYPSTESEVLTTAFGNRIRAFEVYPRDVYGADSISVWLRLISVMSKGFQGAINDARVQVDFLVNVSLLSFLLGMWAFGSVLAWRIGSVVQTSAPAENAGLQAVAGCVCIVVAYLAYRWAIERIQSWGDLVKSAFDCYLPALGKQLGYALPQVESKRRDFWTDFSRVALYRDVMDDGVWTLQPCGSSATGNGGGSATGNGEGDE